MSIIKIKRSGVTGAPSALAQGEFGYSYLAGTLVNGGDRLYIGTGTETNGAAANIEVIGGKYFTDKLDHTLGTLTASSAVLVDSDSKIDQFLVDDLKLDGSTLSVNSTSLANTNLTIQAGATGEIVLASDTRFSGTVDFDGNVTVASLNVEDLTSTRVTYAGTNGELVDDAGFTYTGAGASATLTVAGTLDVDTEALLATAKIEDLTDNRIVIAGTGGELEDDANFTFDGTTFTVGAATITQASGNIETDGTIGADGNVRVGAAGATHFTVDATNGDIGTAGDLTVGVDATFGATGQLAFASANSTVTLAGDLDITGSASIDNIDIDGNTISSTDTNGNITLDPNGSGYVQIAGTNGLVVPVGTTGQQGPSVNGAIRLNSSSGQFEGFSSGNWSSLGGVRSVDGLTFIIAETTPGNSDDTLHFHVATSASTNKEAMTLDEISLHVLNTTASSNTTTGSIIADGGVGIAGDVNIGGDTVLTGDLAVNGGDITTSQTTFNLINATTTTLNIGGAATAVNIGTGGEGGGTTTIGHDLEVTGDVSVNSGQFSVDATTGNAETAGNMIIGGDLTVNGSTTTIDVSTLTVEDALIRLASGNTSGDAVDIGFVGNYNDGTDTHLAGMFRDATTGEFHIFDEYVDSDVTDNVIDISDATFSLADVNINKLKTANQTITLTGDVAGTVTITEFGGGTTATIATTVQADSVALGNDTTGDYVQEVDEGANVTGATAGNNAQTSIYVTGTGESAVVTVQAVIADQVGQVGVATFDSLSNGVGSNRNFDVSASGSVSINTIDGGTY